MARAGTTLRYGANGPEGLLHGKEAYVFATSGGQYAGTETDFYTPYVKHFLGFLGIDRVKFTYAEVWRWVRKPVEWQSRQRSSTSSSSLPRSVPRPDDSASLVLEATRVAGLGLLKRRISWMGIPAVRRNASWPGHVQPPGSSAARIPYIGYPAGFHNG